MKLKTTAFLFVSALFLPACSYTSPAATTTTTPPEQGSTPTTTATPSYVYGTSTTELSTELESTVDDGGQADLKQLKEDSSGL